MTSSSISICLLPFMWSMSQPQSGPVFLSLSIVVCNFLYIVLNIHFYKIQFFLFKCFHADVLYFECSPYLFFIYICSSMFINQNNIIFRSKHSAISTNVEIFSLKISVTDGQLMNFVILLLFILEEKEKNST